MDAVTIGTDRRRLASPTARTISLVDRDQVAAGNRTIRKPSSSPRWRSRPARYSPPPGP